jgi:hypothetical protein
VYKKSLGGQKAIEEYLGDLVEVLGQEPDSFVFTFRETPHSWDLYKAFDMFFLRKVPDLTGKDGLPPVCILLRQNTECVPEYLPTKDPLDIGLKLSGEQKIPILPYGKEELDLLSMVVVQPINIFISELPYGSLSIIIKKESPQPVLPINRIIKQEEPVEYIIKVYCPEGFNEAN